MDRRPKFHLCRLDNLRHSTPSVVYLQLLFMEKLSKVLILFFLIGCNDFLNTWDGYVIEKGAHYSHRDGMPPRVVSLFDGRHLLFDAQFDKSCIYEPLDSSINKLYGFTDCNSQVHSNSVRFGWRVRADSSIDLLAYWYLNGIMSNHYMGNTKPDRVDNYEIWALQDAYYFRFNEKEFSTYRSKRCVHGIRERLFPYFGGTPVAPHRMIIRILEVN